MTKRQVRTTLPSGLSFALSIARPGRPWELEGSGDVFVLRRQHHGDSSAWDYFCAQQSAGPTILSRSDAEALAAALNRNVSARATRTRRESH